MVNQLSGSETKEEPVEKPAAKSTKKPDPVFQPLEGGSGILKGKSGKFFNLPRTELRELERRGKLPAEATQAGVAQERARESSKQAIRDDPSQIGFGRPEGDIPQPEGIEFITEGGKPELTDEQKEQLKKQTFTMVDDGGVMRTIDGLEAVQLGLAEVKTNKEGADTLVGIGVMGAAVLGLGQTALRVGGKLFTKPLKAVQAGTAAKHIAAVKTPMEKLVNFGAKLFVGKELIEGGAGLLTKDVDEQTESLNTLGTETSTIVGDSLGSAGDWRKGLAELQFIKQGLLEYERNIKQGIIRDMVLKVDDRIITINADTSDQISTVNEGITDIRSFAAEGLFPELTPQEIQDIIRELEYEGFVEPADITERRR